MKKLLSIAIAGALFSQPVLAAADMNKVLRVAFNAPESGYDPAKTSDAYANMVYENLLDPLLTYDYLARPAKLIPNVLTAMPAVSENNQTFTFHLKKGIFFAPDAAFKGKKRELTAEDYAYSIKRMVDPQLRSPQAYLVSGKFIGIDDLVKKASKGRLDYDTPIEGIRVLDRYTLQLTTTEAYPSLLYVLAMPQFGAVAREVIEAYGSDTHAHPVGTGPYMLKDWKPSVHTSLVANPNFRKEVFNYQPGNDKEDQQIAREMNGKTIPQIGQIEISVITEEQPTWLAFKGGEIDLLIENPSLPQPVTRQALVMDPNNPLRAELKSKLKAQGIELKRKLSPEVTYYHFNMQDPVVGGFSKEKIALRRAIGMSFDFNESIRDIRRNQAVRMQYLIPNGVVGHRPEYKLASEYNPALANALLEKFNYKIGGDGYRTLPGGHPLLIDFMSNEGAIGRQWDEYWKKAFDRIKIKVQFKALPFNETLKAMNECQYMINGSAWGADFPDGSNFMQLLAGKNIGQTNNACYKSAKYDAMYAKTESMADSPEREALYQKMNKIVAADGPIIFSDTRIRNGVYHNWVKGVKMHPQLGSLWRYLDIQK
jgi:oligopeptide transport system substrate-binding protein